MTRRFAMAALLVLLVLAAGCDRKSADGSEQSAHASETLIPAESDGPDVGGETAPHGLPGGIAGPSEPPAVQPSDSPEKGFSGDNAGPVCFDPAGTAAGWRLVGTDYGFELESDLKDAVVLQTLLAPQAAGNPLVVQIARWNPDGPSELFRKDAIVLDFSARNEPACTVYPLFEAHVNDSYNADSVTKAYGFLDADRLLYVAAGNHPVTGNPTYKVQTLNIRTGENEVLFPDIPGAPMDDAFAGGWLTQDKSKLVLNTYWSGKLWMLDLTRREVRQSGRSYPHFWPLTFTVPSPDGELFWYEDIGNETYRLIDAFGEPVAEMPYPRGFGEYPPFRWTPDGRFAAFAYTRDKEREHIIHTDIEGVNHIAPQGIRFLDRRGRNVLTVETPEGSDEYVELAAWMDGGKEVLLHFFKLDRSILEPGRRPEKVTLGYERLGLATGKRIALQIVADTGSPAEWENSVYVPSVADGSLFRIDTAKNRMMTVHSHPYGFMLPDAGDGEWAWYSGIEGEDAVILYRFDKHQKAATAFHPAAPYHRTPEAVVRHWLIAGSSYIRLGD